MRYLIYGAGGVGGVIGARLHQSGHQVVLIARGANLEALSSRGLRLISPLEEVVLKLPVAGSVQEAGVSESDIVLLTAKSQDTLSALNALRRAGSADVPVVLGQNGVDNERTALRLFNNVYGMLVLLPATHLEPGVVVTYGTRYSGTLPVGRYPSGTDARAEQIASALSASQFKSEARADIMTYKYAKLLRNLANSVQAICGTDVDTAELTDAVRAEGRQILDAAGIDYRVDLASLRQGWEVREPDRHSRGGGSTWQSITRGTPEVETDYLNGEIALHARLLGLDAPLNRTLQDLMREALAHGHKPGWRSPESILAAAGSLQEAT